MVQRSPFRAARLFGGGPPTGRARVVWQAFRVAPAKKTRQPVAVTLPCLKLAAEIPLKGALCGQLEAKFDPVLTRVGSSDRVQRAESGPAHRF